MFFESLRTRFSHHLQTRRERNQREKQVATLLRQRIDAFPLHAKLREWRSTEKFLIAHVVIPHQCTRSEHQLWFFEVDPTNQLSRPWREKIEGNFDNFEVVDCKNYIEVQITHVRWLTWHYSVTTWRFDVEGHHLLPAAILTPTTYVEFEKKHISEPTVNPVA